MQKTVRLGTELINGMQQSVYCKITLEKKDKGQCLSISGVVGPKSNGDCYGSCGQIIQSASDLSTFAPGWDKEKVGKFVQIWDRWHLNDMHAACQHQTGPEWDTSRPIHFAGYKRTKEAKRLQKAAECGELSPSVYKKSQNILALCEKWHGEKINEDQIPGEVLVMVKNGFLEPWHWDHIEKTERSGWVDVKDGGILSKPCPVCGYKYGSAWLFEEIPADVIEWLFSLPDTDTTPAWV